MSSLTGVIFQARCENCQWKGPIHKSPHKKDNPHKFDRNMRKAIKDGSKHRNKKDKKKRNDGDEEHIITVFVNNQPLYIF